MFISTYTNVKAQNIYKNDTLFLKQGGVIVKNQPIKLGKGVKENGNFKHIEVNVNNYLRKCTTSGREDLHALTANYNYNTGRIIRIKDRGNRFIGKKYYAIIAVVGEIKRYQIDLDKAIEDGEVLIDNLGTKTYLSLK